jgi:hypothetical protein
MSRRAAADALEERGMDDRAMAFHRDAQHISTYSDGVKAYIGILAAALATDTRVILIDEPEAFLHPPLARRLGRNLGTIAGERHATVLVATHDADFLMGAVQSGAAVTVVRLTYRAGAATSRVLDYAQLSTLMRDPLLRSTGVLSALFHTGAVVCEADADRAFYQECNERLVSHANDGATDSRFLNAQNKQTIRRLIRPLRSMGIPAAAVADLDILKGDDLLDLLNAAFVPAADRARLEASLRTIQASFQAAAAPLDSVGLAQIGAAVPPELPILLNELTRYGVFVVRVGALEDWLPGLGVPKNKRTWLPAVLQAMGNDPTDARYLLPQAGDVWEFLQHVGQWIASANREGIPA